MRALLVERGGLCSGLVEESIVSDGGLDLEATGGHDRLLAGGDGGHREGGGRGEQSGKPKA